MTKEQAEQLLGPVIANNGTSMTYRHARLAWEAGEFSDWVEAHGGLPIEVDGQEVSTWESIEDALSDDADDEEADDEQD